MNYAMELLWNNNTIYLRMPEDISLKDAIRKYALHMYEDIKRFANDRNTNLFRPRIIFELEQYKEDLKKLL